MFNLQRGDVKRLYDLCVATAIDEGDKSLSPSLETVRSYVHGGNVGSKFSRRIDAELEALKPVQAAKKEVKRTSAKRRSVAAIEAQTADAAQGADVQ